MSRTSRVPLHDVQSIDRSLLNFNKVNDCGALSNHVGFRNFISSFISDRGKTTVLRL